MSENPQAKRNYMRRYFRELRKVKYEPHGFVTQTHCGACYQIWHTLYMRRWRIVNKLLVDNEK
jgi:hypothetical protein